MGAQRSGGADSYYHGLQLQLNKRFSRGFQVQGSYTWSHSIDTSSKQIRGPGESNQSAGTTNPRDMRNERGHSNFDVTHNFTLNYTIDLPGNTLTGAAGHVLGGWQTGGIVTLASGVPETILLGYDNCLRPKLRVFLETNVIVLWDHIRVEGLGRIDAL